MRRALGFLTVLGGPTTPSPGALVWFPVVGGLLGLAVGGIWVGAAHVWPLAAAAAVAVAADALLTGALHLDGVADSGDGLLPALPRERRLVAMSDPHIGAFGVVSVALVLLLRFASLAAGPASAWALAGLWCGARTAAAVVLLTGTYARPEGLATAFHGAASSRARLVAVVALGLAISLAATLVHRPGHGAAALGAEAFAFGALALAAHRRLGGYTGDVLGAGIVVGETAGLLVWAARW